MLKGSHIFEIGDHGAIIVAAPDQQATKSIYYSWNEGLTWESLQISSKPIQVSNIIIEPSNTAEHFVIYGRTTSSSDGNYKESKGIIVSVDFTSLHERVCQNPDKAGEESSDYEKWSPNGKISAQCLMGHKSTYIRRKREARCFNTEQWEQWYSAVNCECTEEDWECDLGFERKKDGPCENQSDEPISFEPPEECDGEFFYVTQGYRKVAGNTCEGGINYDAIKLPCPRKLITKSKVLLLLLVISLSGGAYLYSMKTNPISFNKKPNYPTGTNLTSGSSFTKHGFRKMDENSFPDSLNDDSKYDDDF